MSVRIWAGYLGASVQSILVNTIGERFAQMYPPETRSEVNKQSAALDTNRQREAALNANRQRGVAFNTNRQREAALNANRQRGAALNANRQREAAETQIRSAK